MEYYLAEVKYEKLPWETVTGALLRPTLKEALHDAFCEAVCGGDGIYRISQLGVIKVGMEMEASRVIEFDQILQKSP